MMKITGLSHLFKWENLHNWWLTKYFFAPLYILHLYFTIIPQVFISVSANIEIYEKYYEKMFTYLFRCFAFLIHY